MSETGWTSGPWEWIDDHYGTALVGEAEGWDAGVLAYSHEPPLVQPRQANAELIALAPEMAEVILDIVATNPKEEWWWDYFGDIVRKLLAIKEQANE